VTSGGAGATEQTVVASAPAAGRVPVSVIIAARNESATIGACVESVWWGAEVIVADHQSSDETARVAESAGARVIATSAPTIGGARNDALAVAAQGWVLVVDADERATPRLRDAVARTISAPTNDAYRVRRRNFFLGREVRHGGWERDRPVRLFRQRMRYDASRVHEHVVTEAPAGTLDAALLHYPYPTLDHYFAKLDRYSQWWAADQHERGRRASLGAVLLKPPARFLNMYLLRGGFLDGAAGCLLAGLAGTSVFAKYARLWALEHAPRSVMQSAPRA